MKITLNIISVIKQYLQFLSLLGSLSKDVFERRMSIGSEAFSIFICLDADKFVLPSLFSLVKTIYPRVSTKQIPNDAKSSLPVDFRRSKTLLLKLPIILDKTKYHYCEKRILGFPYRRGTQPEYSSKPLKYSIVKRILVFKR